MHCVRGVWVGALALGFVIPAAADAGDIHDELMGVGNPIIEDLGEERAIDVGRSKSDFPMPLPSEGENPEDVLLDQIINAGRKLWKVVEANRPVLRFEGEAANAMPAGLRSWQSLERWMPPKAHLYRVRYENLYGITVVDFTFRVSFAYGGSYRGRGHYLANVSIVPKDLLVSWGYTFDAKVTVAKVLNAGTTGNPVAAMQVNLDWTIDTVVRKTKSTASYYVRGDGAFVDLSNGN